MYVIERHLDFEHPVARVWEVFTDLENWGEWSETKTLFRSNKMSFAPAEGSLRGPGLRIVAKNKKGDFLHTLIAEEWDKPKRVQFKTLDPGPKEKAFKLDMTWIFSQPSASSTHLDYHLKFDFSIPDIFAPFVQRAAEKKVDQIFARSRSFL